MAGDIEINGKQAIGRLLRFLAIEGVTGEEGEIAHAVVEELRALGIPRAAIRCDGAERRIPLPTESGNVVVKLPGTRPGRRRLLLTHLDTVPLCAGARPARRGHRIVATGATALGADNRTGVACLVTLAATLIQKSLPHPPLTLLFTVREESGLWGARYLDTSLLGDPVYGFNVDGRLPAEITIGAVGAERWEAEIYGQAAHAGAHPERGISATMVAALALAEVHREGWFGRIRHDGHAGASNVGTFGGPDGKSAGLATNVVTDYALIRGEARSHDSRFVRAITAAYRRAFANAARKVHNDQHRRARVRFRARRVYYPFRLKETAPVVQHAVAAAKSIGLRPTLKVSNGGLDANWLVRHGIPTITFGAGQNNIHAVGEYVALADFEEGCRLAVALATGAD
jgi:tripeptide aminopeptidase